MRIATFNVNSLRSRLPVLTPWLAEVKPDILCLQETKVQDSQFPLEEIRALGYHAAYRGQKSYNGVAVLSRTKPDEVRFGFGDGEEPDCDTRMMAARFDRLWVVNSYVPQGKAIDHPDYEFKKNFLRRCIPFLKALGPQVLWCGDFNVAPTPLDVANPQTKTKHVCYYKELRELYCELTSDLVDLFRRFIGDRAVYSFFDYRVKDSLDRNLGWRIDHMMATPELAQRCTDCRVDHEPRRAERPSDHTPVLADFD